MRTGWIDPEKIRRLFFIAASCAIIGLTIVVAGGGASFLRRPVGITYLILSLRRLSHAR